MANENNETLHENNNPSDAPLNASASTPESNEEEILAKLRQEASDLKDRTLRQMAEMENMRKRFEREKSDLAKFATENLLSDMMPVLDSFEQASGSPDSNAAEQGTASFRDGLLMVKKQLLTVLRKHGLEQLESVGKPFDPNFHQAIQRIETPDASSDTVATEFAKGYTLNGRLLRAAMVSVKVPTQS